MKRVGFSFQPNVAAYRGLPPSSPTTHQIYSLLLGITGQLSYGSPEGAIGWSQGPPGGAFHALGGYLGQSGGQYFGQQGEGHGHHGYGYGFGGYQHAGHSFTSGLRSQKTWDLWFEDAKGRKLPHRSPILLDLHHGRTRGGRVGELSPLLDLDPSRASYGFQCRARRPNRSAPKAPDQDHYWGRLNSTQKTEWLRQHTREGKLVWDGGADGRLARKTLFDNYDDQRKERFQSAYRDLAHRVEQETEGSELKSELFGGYGGYYGQFPPYDIPEESPSEELLQKLDHQLTTLQALVTRFHFDRGAEQQVPKSPRKAPPSSSRPAHQQKRVCSETTSPHQEHLEQR